MAKKRLRIDISHIAGFHALRLVVKQSIAGLSGRTDPSKYPVDLLFLLALFEVLDQMNVAAAKRNLHFTITAVQAAAIVAVDRHNLFISTDPLEAAVARQLVEKCNQTLS